MDKIAVRVKAIRKKNKDTLKSLAEKIDYDWSNLSKVERGIYSASTEILEKIAKTYNVDISYFFTEKIEELNEKSLTRAQELKINEKTKLLLDKFEELTEENKKIFESMLDQILKGQN